MRPRLILCMTSKGPWHARLNNLKGSKFLVFVANNKIASNAPYSIARSLVENGISIGGEIDVSDAHF